MLYGSLCERPYFKFLALEAARVLELLGAEVKVFGPSGLPLALFGSVRPMQGRTLAVMQVSGSSQSFSCVNQIRTLGRWMRMITIPNQSSVPNAFTEFDEAGHMLASPLYNRKVDVMEELMKFTHLTRGGSAYLTD